MHVIVDESLCIGCEACVPPCPNKAITMKGSVVRSSCHSATDADTVYMVVERRP
ncbi:MAG: 4Fe-4S binding protein [Thermoplasmata archaeon]